MAKEEIIIHGNLCDLINYKAFIENQASELAFLDYPKEYKVKETNTKPKVKRLNISYKKADCKRNKW